MPSRRSSLCSVYFTMTLLAIHGCSPSTSVPSGATLDPSPLATFDRVEFAPIESDDADHHRRAIRWAPPGESINRNVRFVGRLVDSSGDPFAGGLVEVRVPQQEEAFPTPEVLASTRTDTTGRFELPTVGTGTELEIAIDACRGQLRRELPQFAASDRTHDLGDVLVVEDRTLRGAIVVLDQDGNAIPRERIQSHRIQVQMASDAGKRRSRLWQSTAPEGFVFREIDFNRAHFRAYVSFTDGTRASFEGEFEIPAGDSTFEIRLPLDSLVVVDDRGTKLGSVQARSLPSTPRIEDDVVLRGRVVDQHGDPLEGASVHLANLNRTPAGLTRRTGRDGRFEIECRPWDVQVLVVRALGRTVRRYDAASGRGPMTPTAQARAKYDAIIDLREPFEVIVPADPDLWRNVADHDAPERNQPTPEHLKTVHLEGIPERATLNVRQVRGLANYVNYRSHAGGTWRGKLPAGSYQTTLTDDGGDRIATRSFTIAPSQGKTAVSTIGVTSGIDQPHRLTLELPPLPAYDGPISTPTEWAILVRDDIPLDAAGLSSNDFTPHAAKGRRSLPATIETLGEALFEIAFSYPGDFIIECKSTTRSLGYAIRRRIEADPNRETHWSLPPLNAALRASARTYSWPDFPLHRVAGPRLVLRHDRLADNGHGFDLVFELPRVDDDTSRSFTLPNLPRGSYQIHQHLIGNGDEPRYAWGAIPVELEAGSVAPLPDFADYEIGDLEVRVRDASGKPVDGPRIAVFDEYYEESAAYVDPFHPPMDPLAAPTDDWLADGIATLDSIRVGRLDLVVEGEGWTWRGTRDVEPDRILHITLPFLIDDPHSIEVAATR